MEEMSAQVSAMGVNNCTRISHLRFACVVLLLLYAAFTITARDGVEEVPADLLILATEAYFTNAVYVLDK